MTKAEKRCKKQRFIQINLRCGSDLSGQKTSLNTTILMLDYLVCTIKLTFKLLLLFCLLGRYSYLNSHLNVEGIFQNIHDSFDEIDSKTLNNVYKKSKQQSTNQGKSKKKILCNERNACQQNCTTLCCSHASQLSNVKYNRFFVNI